MAKSSADEVPDERREGFDSSAAFADKDGDGAISHEEMVAGLARVREQFSGKGQDIEPEKIFEYLDRNADGKLTLDEVPSERQKNFQQGLRFGDRDGDGALSQEEFIKVVNRHRALQKAHRVDGHRCACYRFLIRFF